MLTLKQKISQLVNIPASVGFSRKIDWGVGGHIPFMVTRLLSEFDNCIVIEDSVQISNKVLISV
jgi:hypothetical protein